MSVSQGSATSTGCCLCSFAGAASQSPTVCVTSVTQAYCLTVQRLEGQGQGVDRVRFSEASLHGLQEAVSPALRDPHGHPSVCVSVLISSHEDPEPWVHPEALHVTFRSSLKTPLPLQSHSVLLEVGLPRTELRGLHAPQHHLLFS